MSDSNNYQASVARKTRVLSVRDVQYCVNEWGDESAPQIFYLHGWADTGSTFQFVVDSLTSKWCVVAPDWRGFGRTEHSVGSYWFPDYLADLHELLKHYSPHSPVNLVGHSMGGNVASLYAGAQPERVKGLINIEGFGLSDSDPDDAPQRYRDWLQAQEDGVVFTSYPDFENLARRIRLRNPGLSEVQANFVAREWARESGGSVRLRADPKHRLPNAVLYRRAEAEACWRNISAAVLLLSGSNSPFARQFGERASLPFPNSQTHIIPDVGHMIHFEAPMLLAAQIERFFK